MRRKPAAHPSRALARWALRSLLFLSLPTHGVGCRDAQNVVTNPKPVHQVNADASMEIEYDQPNDVGFARIRMRDGANHLEGIVDSHRKAIVPPLPNLLVNDITGNMALVQVDRKFLFVPLDEGPFSRDDLESVPGFQYAMPYRCGLALVVVDDAWFYINAEGTPAFDARFDFAESFHDDRALVKRGETFEIIDTRGHVVAHLDYDQVSPQSLWCWQVTNTVAGKFRSGFIDRNGRPITDLIYEEVGYYDAEVDRIRVGRDGRYGFLDGHAQVAIPIEFEYAEIFDDGKARVMRDGRTYFIDPRGNEVPE